MSSLHDNNFGRSQTRWGGNMSKKGKKGKIGKNCPKIWRPMVIRVRYVRKVKSA